MISRIYHSNPISLHDTITLDKKAAQHCLNVLRLKTGQVIELFCGDNHVYAATLTVQGTSLTATIIDKAFKSVESNIRIHLGQGLARNDRMDWIIQKAVECGVTEITPLMTHNSIIKLKEDRLANKLSHWQKIIISACEQSGRNIIPTLHAPQKLESWINQSFEGTTICFNPNADKSLKQLNPTNQSFRVALGPESGFSTQEIKLFNSLNVDICHLGQRILRTETATVASLSAIQTNFGDYL